MPVIPPSRSEPYVPPDQIVRDGEPGEPAERASRSELTIVLIVAIALFVVFLAAVVFPHSPFAAGE